MRVSLKAIIDYAHQSPTPDLGQLCAQLSRTGRHHAPKEEDVRAAVACGSPQVVDAVMGAGTLDSPQRARLATNALHAWADNPLASRQAPAIVQTLLKHGADPLQKGPQGQSALDKTLPMVSRLWEQEAHRTGQRKGTTLPPAASGTLLAQCVASLRMAAGIPGPVNLDAWRQGRAGTSTSASFQTCTSPRAPGL